MTTLQTIQFRRVDGPDYDPKKKPLKRRATEHVDTFKLRAVAEARRKNWQIVKRAPGLEEGQQIWEYIVLPWLLEDVNVTGEVMNSSDPILQIMGSVEAAKRLSDLVLQKCTLGIRLDFEGERPLNMPELVWNVYGDTTSEFEAKVVSWLYNKEYEVTCKGVWLNELVGYWTVAKIPDYSCS